MTGNGEFETISIHFFDVDPAEATGNVENSPTDAGVISSDNNDESSATIGQPAGDPPPCTEQVSLVAGTGPLICYADMGRAGFEDGIVFNESPFIQQCFMMRGEGEGVSVDSVQSSMFGSISDQVRSVALGGNKNTQMLSIDDSDILSPQSSDFTVMMWVKLLPTNFANGVWVASHGNPFKNRAGWSIQAAKNQIKFRANDGIPFGKRIFAQIHDDQWHHIAMVVDRSGTGKMHAYLDGSEMLDKSFPGAGSGQSDLVKPGGTIEVSSEFPFALGVRINGGMFVEEF